MVAIALSFSLLTPVMAATKPAVKAAATVKAAPKAVVKVAVKSTTKKKAPAKSAAKPVAKPVAKKVVNVGHVTSIRPNGAIVAVASAAVTKPNLTCLQAMDVANKYCKKIAVGCASYSESPKCVEANKECDEQQQEALSLCPAI